MARQIIGEKPKDLKQTLRLLWAYMKKHRGILSAVVALAIISRFRQCIRHPICFGPLSTATLSPANTSGLIGMLLFMGGLYLTGVAATYGYTQLMVKAAQRIVSDMRRDLFAKVQTLPLRVFDATTHGELMSRFTNDIDTISEALNSGFAVMIQFMAVFLGTMTVLVIMNVTLSLIVILSLLGMFSFLRYSTKKSHGFFKSQQKYLGGLNGFVEESVQGQKVIKVFNHEDKNFEEFADRNAKLRDAATSAVMFGGFVIPTVSSISYLNYALTSCIGAFLVISGGLDIGTLASYLVYVRQTAMPLIQMSQQLNLILAALSGAERIFQVMDLSAERDEGNVTLVNVRANEDGTLAECAEFTGQWAWKRPLAGGGTELIPLRGDVRFHDVVFGYEKGIRTLDQISLYAKPGQKIAFVGSTGAGKTTIANLINRFYDVNEGVHHLRRHRRARY